MRETNFKQTDLGFIPHNWKIEPLGKYIDNFTGLTYSPNDVVSHGMIVLRSANIQNDKLVFEDNVYVSCDVPKRAMTQHGDILVCVRNGSARLVGKSTLIDSEKPMAFGAFMTVLRCHLELNNLYLSYYWKSDFLQNQINDNKGNIINQITSADIARYYIILPNKKEQERIGATLSSIDKLISKLNNLIEKKRAIKDGAMSQLLSGKLRLPGFSQPWISSSLDEMGVLLSNNTLSRDNLTESGTIGNIHYGDILTRFGAILDLDNTTIPFIHLQLSGKFLKSHLAEEGDVIFADTAEDETVGKATELVNVKGRVIVSGLHTFWFRPLKKFASKFLGYAVNSHEFHRQVIPVISGTKVCSISKPNLLSFTLTYPSDLEEQKAIAKVLTDMDEEISALEAKLKKYEQLKKGMMQQLLTGKIRLVSPNESLS